MTNPVPDWLAPQPTHSNSTPDWLVMTSKSEPAPRTDTPEGKALLFTQYEMVFPRILEMMAAGYTVKKAFRDLPVEIDRGGFMNWLYKRPNYFALYKQAKELRAEAWADDLIRFAEGKDEEGNETMEDVSRSRLKVDTLWKLMGSDHRKQYGDTKTIEMNTTISITAALAQAQERVMVAQVIDDADVIEATSYQLLEPGDDDDE